MEPLISPIPGSSCRGKMLWPWAVLLLGVRSDAQGIQNPLRQLHWDQDQASLELHLDLISKAWVEKDGTMLIHVWGGANGAKKHPKTWSTTGDW